MLNFNSLLKQKIAQKKYQLKKAQASCKPLDFSLITTPEKTAKMKWQICLDTKTLKSAIKSKCYKCKTIVHNMWYQRELGAKQVEIWYWDRWTKLNYCPDIDITSIKCEVCHQITGPILKINIPDIWCHLSCLTAFSEVEVYDFNRKVSGRIPEKYYYMKCDYWNESYGACINCTKDDWLNYIHPQWALMKNNLCFNKFEGYTSHSDEISLFCNSHLALKYKSLLYEANPDDDYFMLGGSDIWAKLNSNHMTGVDFNIQANNQAFEIIQIDE